MRKIAVIVSLLFALTSTAAFAQDIQFGKGAFDANFQVDSTFTTDGKTFEVSASGEAGPYGKAYLSYVFTDKLGLGDAGEFTGFAWAQKGKDVSTATLQGIYKKDGKVFQMYSLDLDSNGELNVVSGVADFVAGTMKFKVSKLK